MNNDNRIGAACWYRPSDVAVGPWRAGMLRMWGTDHEEYESGPGLFPIGVVEDCEHRTCHAVYVSRICFAASPPNQ